MNGVVWYTSNIIYIKQYYLYQPTHIRNLETSRGNFTNDHILIINNGPRIQDVLGGISFTSKISFISKILNRRSINNKKTSKSSGTRVQRHNKPASHRQREHWDIVSAIPQMQTTAKGIAFCWLSHLHNRCLSFTSGLWHQSQPGKLFLHTCVSGAINKCSGAAE